MSLSAAATLAHPVKGEEAYTALLPPSEPYSPPSVPLTRGGVYWALLNAWYAIVFVVRAVVAACLNPLDLVLKHRGTSARLKRLQSLLFRPIASSWTGPTCGEYVRSDDGWWYRCVKTNGFHYSALDIPAPTGEIDNSIDPEQIRLFEERLAMCLDGSDAVLFVTGWQANVATIRALHQCNKSTLFVWDSDSHRSSFEGFKNLPNRSFDHNVRAGHPGNARQRTPPFAPHAPTLVLPLGLSTSQRALSTSHAHLPAPGHG
jgi:hypothetical protein